MDSIFPLDRLDEISRHPQDFKLLERVPFTRNDFRANLPIQLVQTHPQENAFPLIFIDTETTGLSYIRNKMIQISMVRCTYSVDQGCIVSIDECWDEFEDPLEPIPEEIVNLTGITDAMVRGRSFNERKIAQFIPQGALMISHNAKFDRPFFDKRFNRCLDVNSMPWACSLEEIDWKKMGFYGSKLEFLAQSLGFFYDAHLAINDAFALCFLLYKVPAALDCLLDSAIKDSFRIEALDTRYEVKDRLKTLNFRWDGLKKCWYFCTNNGPYATEIANRVQAMIDETRQGKLSITRFTSCERYRVDQNYGR